jgi:hypothetical protein
LSKAQQKSPKRRTPETRTRRRPRRAPTVVAEPVEPLQAEIVEAVATPEWGAEPAEPPGPPADVTLAVPETAFAARAVPPEPERPLPATRRAIFFDVENTSRAEHIARVIDHLAVDRMGKRTEFIAVGNWKVIGADTARLLARHGAQLVHSAPSTGVRDWSDLRIAVSAGVWLAVARPGDVIEIVSDDRAFDAVGDVAASIGIAFRRLSYRGLVASSTDGGAGRPAPVHDAAPHPAAPAGGRGRRRRGRRRGGWRDGGAPAHHAPVHHAAPHQAPAPAAPRTAHPPAVAAEPPAGVEAHTAPHDEILAIVEELISRTPGRGVSLDALANALKSRGFRRTPGSPRLITRLKRIKELAVSGTGIITLVGEVPHRAPAPAHVEAVEPAPPEEEVAVDDAPEPGNEKEAEAAATPGRPPARRRRSRRGGRGRRGRGQRAATTTA